MSAQTTACSACTGRVATTAKTCPHCGKSWPAGTPASSKLMAAGTAMILLPMVAVIVIGVVVLLVAAGR